MGRKTKTLVGQKARDAVLKGVMAIYDPVRLTFGPQGRNALLYRTYGRGARITNDGYTVAEVQEPREPFVQMAAEAFKEACKRTNEKVGDGTTGTAIFGGKAFLDGTSLLGGSSAFTASGMGKLGVMTIRKNILESADRIKLAIRESAKKVESLEELERIATISVEDPVLGKVIAQMAWDVGVDGFIETTEGYRGEIETEVIKGMRFPAKIAAKAFLNNAQRFEMVATDCSVLLTNYALDNAQEAAKVFSEINKKGVSKIIVIAPAFSDPVLVNMVKASQQGFVFYPVHAPSLRTDQFEDLAVYFDATFIDKAKGKAFSATQTRDLGFVEKLIVKDTEAKEDAVATGGRGTSTTIQNGAEGDVEEMTTSSPVQERITVLKGQLEETRQDNFKKLLERRIASMNSAVGIIRVGDSTQASVLYLKLKVEDAVYACKAALRSGYVKGGGLCLKEIAENMDENDILKGACMAPYEQIQSSVDGGIEIGPDIIDAADAVYYAVEHGAGVVSNLITVEIMTPEIEDTNPGDGYMGIARAMGEMSIALKKHFGQMKEGEEEMERDRMQGLTDDERVALDNG